MTRVVLGLGTNLGARRAILLGAELALRAQPGLSVLARSALYETPPLGPPQPDYLNSALLVEFAGETSSLMAVTRHVELLLGRERRERWGARTIDIDLLWSSEGNIDTPSLKVPHPELTKRDFALAPLLDVLPELSTRYADTLASLGGSPAHATVGFPVVQVDDTHVRVHGAQDDLELSSLLTSAVIRCGREELHAPYALGFGGHERDASAITERLVNAADRLATQGFGAGFACITHVSADGFRGVFLGEHGTSSRVARLLTVRRERRGRELSGIAEIARVA